MIPFDTQLEGAAFLANRRRAALFDEPRVGKTGAAIIASDYVLATNILVITTGSGRAVWQRAFGAWSKMGRKVQVLLTGKERIDPDADVTIIGWAGLTSAPIRAVLLRQQWHTIIVDEDHYAKNFDAKRTQGLYGVLDGDTLQTTTAVVTPDTEYVWTLSGTPLPNSPFDTFPRLKALAPERLDRSGERPDVSSAEAFMKRYCVTRIMKRGFERIPIIVGGRNTDELAARMKGFALRRTQADVGIRAPIYETLPLYIPAGMRKKIEADVDCTAIMKAAEDGSTRDLEMELGPLRRLTGGIKAHAVADAVKDDLNNGLDKIVLAYWHRDTGDILEKALAEFGVLRLDGSTLPAARGPMEQKFLHDKSKRVWLGQIQASGEAIDLSSAAVLLFVEMSFVPSHMKQMSLRVTNHTATRQAFVRVAVLSGSIDEASQEVLMRKWVPINEVLNNDC